MIDSRMRAGKRKNLRIICLCGQRMKVTEAMYGRAAKCVACHEKWFVPKQDEIESGTAEIYLKDHPELLRRPGVFIRSEPDPARRELLEQPAEEGIPDPLPLMVSDEEANGDRDEEVRRSGESPETPEDDDAASPECCRPADESREEEFVSDREARARIRSREKKPFDILECLRLLCCYEHTLENLEHRVLANEEPAFDENLLGAYQRSLKKVRNKITERLKKQHDSVDRQLAGLEKEIDRLAVSLRLGDVDLADFLAQTASLRNTRESLIRYDHHLQAWQNVRDPFLAGGLTDVAMDSFDEASFDADIPGPCEIDDSEPLFARYSDELRRAMHTRSSLELRIEEWKRLSAERPVAAFSLEIGMAESSAARERAESAIGFFRRRLQVLLTDCVHDLESLDKYRRDVLDRDRKGQIKRQSKETLLKDIEGAESGLIRVQAHIQKALHANAEAEVPVPSTTLAERFSRKREINLQVPAAIAFFLATLSVLTALLLLSYRETGSIHRLVVLPLFFAVLHPCTLLFRDAWTRKGASLVGWVYVWGLIAAALIMLSRYTPIQPGRFILPRIDMVGLLLLFGAACSGMAVGMTLIGAVRSFWRAEVLVPLFAAVLTTLVAGVSYVYAQTAVARVDGERSVIPLEKVPEPLPQSRVDVFPDSDATTSVVAHTDGAHESPVEDPGEVSQPALVSPSTGEDNTGVSPEGEEIKDLGEGAGANSVSLSLAGVVHGEGISPRFRATTQYYDGRHEEMTIKLGDVIAGEWKAMEYNSEEKKLTVTNGERMLLLGAGDTVVIDDYVSGEGEP